jgi:type I restriction enzyme, S subunit
MTITRYEKYKPSGIQWLGEIPKHWEIKRVKDLGEIRYGLGQPPRQKEGGLPIIRATNVERGKINENNMIFVDPDDIPYDRDPVLKENDIIVVRSGAYTADSAIIPKKYAGAITGYDLVFRPKKIYPKYIAYSLLSNFLLKDQLIPLSLRAAQPHLNKDELGISVTVFPKYHEQTAIAHYLDTKTATIDAKIALLAQKMGKYKELSKSLINETVCRGLDKNAPMKESGIEWIGKIPEHWAVKRFKDFLKKIVDGTHFTPDYQDSGVNFLSVNDITRQPFDINQSKFISIEEHKMLYKRCNPEKGDILLSKNGTIGVPFIIDLDIEFSIYVSLCLLKVGNNVYNKYFYYLLLSDFMFEQYKINAKTNSVSNLHLDKLANFHSILPPKSEQTAIATYLDQQTGKIAAIMTNLGLQIEGLKALRKTLINDVVTGKVKVV